MISRSIGNLTKRKAGVTSTNVRFEIRDLQQVSIEITNYYNSHGETDSDYLPSRKTVPNNYF